MKRWVRGLAAVGMLAAAGLFQGCEVDSADDVQRVVGVDFTGFYRNPNTLTNTSVSGSGSNAVTNAVIVTQNITSRNSGTPITSLDLRQNGDRLEAIDNAGNVWKGSLGEFNGTSSSFELVGRTTAGTEGRFSGILTTGGTANDSNVTSVAATEGTMSGTYIEETFFGTFYAEATIPGIIVDNGGGGGSGSGLSISPPSATLNANGSSQSFSVSGGSGNYAWSVSGASGSLSSTTGSSVNYTRTSSGNNTITVSDVNDSSKVASATIIQP